MGTDFHRPAPTPQTIDGKTREATLTTLTSWHGPGSMSQSPRIVPLMAFAIVDWNVNGFRLSRQVEWLDSLDWDIALLQEVTRDTWPLFRELGTAGGVAFDHLPAMVGAGPRFATAVLVRGEASLWRFGVLRDVPSPERAAVAAVDLDGRRTAVCSWAAPPATSWGDAGKGRQVLRFAAWLQARSGPVIVGIDRNAPKWDRLELERDEWWNRDEPLLYGPNRVHDLRDAFRDLVDRDPQLREAIMTDRPDGPLAVTHRRRGTDCRYDAVYVSPEFDVVSVDHLMEEAEEAGGDHGAVLATLAWRC